MFAVCLHTVLVDVACADAIEVLIDEVMNVECCLFRRAGRLGNIQ